MAQPLIEIDSERMGGTPIFYGTRVPIKTLIDHLVTGESIEVFLDDFPSVSREQVIRFIEEATALMIAHANEELPASIPDAQT